jgi:hypothetical protein
MSVKVQLTAQEMLTAALVGVRRQISAMELHRRDSWTNADNPFEIHILGCMGELVAAKHFNLFWPDAVGETQSHDVGGLLEVRTRRGGAMGIRVNHKPEKPYLLIHADVEKGIFQMMGWLLGAQAWKVGRPCDGNPNLRYVDPGVLLPVEELNKVIFVS